MSFYVSTATFFLLHCDEWDRVVALPRHKFVTGATLLQLVMTDTFTWHVLCKYTTTVITYRSWLILLHDLFYVNILQLLSPIGHDWYFYMTCSMYIYYYYHLASSIHVAISLDIDNPSCLPLFVLLASSAFWTISWCSSKTMPKNLLYI